MASFKKTFASLFYAARSYASGMWRGNSAVPQAATTFSVIEGPSQEYIEVEGPSLEYLPVTIEYGHLIMGVYGADINDTVVLGFGSWSNVNALPTLGYGAYSVQPSNYIVLEGPPT